MYLNTRGVHFAYCIQENQHFNKKNKFFYFLSADVGVDKFIYSPEAEIMCCYGAINFILLFDAEKDFLRTLSLNGCMTRWNKHPHTIIPILILLERNIDKLTKINHSK